MPRLPTLHTWIVALVALVMVIGPQAARGTPADARSFGTGSTAPTPNEEERHEHEQRVAESRGAPCQSVGDPRPELHDHDRRRAVTRSTEKLRASVAPLREPSVLSVRRQL